MVDNIEFTSGGVPYALNRKQVERMMRGIAPGRIHTHVVVINDVLYPVKEAYGHVLGKDSLDFNTQEARSVFKRLGFVLRRVS